MATLAESKEIIRQPETAWDENLGAEEPLQQLVQRHTDGLLIGAYRDYYLWDDPLDFHHRGLGASIKIPNPVFGWTISAWRVMANWIDNFNILSAYRNELAKVERHHEGSCPDLRWISPGSGVLAGSCSNINYRDSGSFSGKHWDNGP